jgi:Flp pilus assembly pilin Flp
MSRATDDSDQTENLIDDRAEELLRRAAERAEEERPLVDGQFLRENEVTATEMGEIMALLSMVLLGFCNAGRHLQTAILVSGAGAGDLPESVILKTVMENLQREELERLRSEFDSRTE